MADEEEQAQMTTTQSVLLAVAVVAIAYFVFVKEGYTYAFLTSAQNTPCEKPLPGTISPEQFKGRQGDKGRIRRKGRREGYDNGIVAQDSTDGPSRGLILADNRNSASPDVIDTLAAGGDWKSAMTNMAIDSETAASQQRWVQGIQGRTTTANPWSVFDHDINSNWVGPLRWGNTWTRVFPQAGARQSVSNDPDTMPKSSNASWGSIL